MSQPVQSSQASHVTSPEQTPPPPKKQGNLLSRLSSRTRVMLALIVIALAVVLAFLGGPREGESDNVTGDQAITPTVVVTNLVDSVNINHTTTINGLHLTITKAIEATKFSDDRKRGGTYIVRVIAHTYNGSPNAIGVQFDHVVWLVLPDGTSIVPKYISILPDTLPDRAQDGFFDFPLSTQVPLNSLVLHVGSVTIPFSK